MFTIPYPMMWKFSQSCRSNQKNYCLWEIKCQNTMLVLYLADMGSIPITLNPHQIDQFQIPVDQFQFNSVYTFLWFTNTKRCKIFVIQLIFFYSAIHVYTIIHTAIYTTYMHTNKQHVHNVMVCVHLWLLHPTIISCWNLQSLTTLRRTPLETMVNHQ